MPDRSTERQQPPTCECPARKALREIATCGFADIDPRIKYLEVQVSRREWAEVQAALAALCPCDQLRKETEAARTEAAARLKQFLTQVEIHTRSTKEWRVSLDAAESEREQLRAENAALREQLELDRTALADAITGIKKTADSRFWLTEGRGSYEWDDDRYRGEFREAYQEISKAIEPLKKIAADWSGCPRKAEDIAKARIDLKAENQRLRAELATANAETEGWKATHASLSDGVKKLAEYIGCDPDEVERTFDQLRAELTAANAEIEQLHWQIATAESQSGVKGA